MAGVGCALGAGPRASVLQGPDAGEAQPRGRPGALEDIYRIPPSHQEAQDIQKAGAIQPRALGQSRTWRASTHAGRCAVYPAALPRPTPLGWG